MPILSQRLKISLKAFKKKNDIFFIFEPVIPKLKITLKEIGETFFIIKLKSPKSFSNF